MEGRAVCIMVHKKWFGVNRYSFKGNSTDSDVEEL